MRGLFKHFLIDTATLYGTSVAISGIYFEKGISTLLLTGFVLTLTTMIIKPIVNVLLLPINLVTLGLFKWLGFAITLYLVTLIVPGFQLHDFVFRGYSSSFFTIPGLTLTGTLAFMAFSFLISTISSFIYWIFK